MLLNKLKIIVYFVYKLKTIYCDVVIASSIIPALHLNIYKAGNTYNFPRNLILSGHVVARET